ncbi:hypothetical protein I350_05439 [Cryptococcus amylolentus CBS 6273]|uniref:Histone deacetylase domain-containing protein n=1 Tax=Cryptococcus amylolentus CBS 6273 TaxID=1296118 RepID=A0A1E3JVH0_9TREE|nr:hypothetical protein I350_05439 [Cryptococcus amylolentus CBS 6273]
MSVFSSSNESPATAHRRVAYIWSAELERVSNDLPSNVGRSSMVHDLIRSLGLLDSELGYETEENHDDDEEESREIPDTDNSGWIRPMARIIPPDPSLGTKACLLRYHDKGYLDRLYRPENDVNEPSEDPTHPSSSPRSSSSSSSPRPRKILRADPYNLSHDNPIFDTLPLYVSLVSAATSTACRLLAQDKADWAVCWDGGRHHAKRKEAGGFCYVNDLVLGGLLLSREGRVTVSPQQVGHDPTTKVKTRPPRILYLDMDFHYGDGVSAAFHSPKTYPHPLKPDQPIPKPPNVLTLSIHHSSPVFYPPPTPLSLLPSPDTTSPFSLAVPLAAYPSRETYAKVWTTCIEPIQEAWNPDYVILQMGTDGLPGDRVGQYGNWAVEGEGGIKWAVEQVKKWDAKVCVTGGGGYRHDNAARAWAEVMGVLLDRDFEHDMAIPHHDHFEQYAPSFTMQVPESHVRDENTEEELNKAGAVFKVLADRIALIVTHA